ncbi:MAG TPA: RNA polymerase sigma factor, partial [Bacteroidia bacterium]|nr:RNA polymerase sigma factor [Bacteroidia bacterium]
MTESSLSPSFDADSLACHYTRLRNFIRRAVSDEEEASDIAQESYLRLVRYGEGREVHNGEWLLYRIARNLIVDRFRRRSTHPEDAVAPELFASHPELASGIDPGRVADARDHVRQVEEAVLALPERCRE